MSEQTQLSSVRLDLYGTSMTSTKQPQNMGLAPMTGSSVAGMPESLSYLAGLDQLIIKQKKEMMEIITGFEMNNRYDVMNSMKQSVFFVQEETGFCMRQCCKQNRGFVLHFFDNNSQEVMRITREFKCCVGCCWCADGSCGFMLQVEAPVGNVVGYVKQMGSKWRVHLEVMDAQKQHLYSIWGPCCPCQAVCCTDDVDFPVTRKNSYEQIGTVAKQWGGLLRESITDADTFNLTFPMSMPVNEKATMIGAVFLIDFMLFEKQQN